MNNEEIVEAIIERLRPALNADGGDIEVLGIDDRIVRVRLTGACAGCPSAEMMTIVRSGFSAALLAAAIVAAVPAASLEARQAPRTVTLTVTDPVGEKMAYSLKQIVAKPGEKLKVRLVSMAKVPKIVMAHNFVLLKLGTDPKKFAEAAANARSTDFIPPSMKTSIIASTGMVGPGESMEAVFVAPKAPGKYVFLCSFAGHYAAGMWGELIVK